MTPLEIFGIAARLLVKRPFAFLHSDVQASFLKEEKMAVYSLIKALEDKKLHATLVYKSVKAVHDVFVAEDFDEVSFVQNLDNLVDIYSKSSDKKLKKQAIEIKSDVTKAKNCLLEYHILLEKLAENGAEMSEEQRDKNDLKHIQSVGIFYVLEYTLQVFYEFCHISDTDKKKLLTVGLKTNAGNLPGYLPLEDSFRHELCLKIFDENLRDKLLMAFYEFEDFITEKIDLKKFGIALKNFNLTLLQAFKEKGLKVFKALVYKPFGNNVDIEEVIKNIKNLKI